MRHRKLSGATLATTLFLLLITTFIKTTHQIGETTSKQVANNQTATTSSSEQITTSKQQITTNQTTANLTVESLNERLVKQSNLQAEESRQDEGQTVFVPAPVSFREQPARDVKRASTFVSGGSGDSYLSMSHDGSNRYDFGFDTSRKQEHETRRKPAPRLMREESRLEDGTVIGRYGYTDPFNVFRIVQYVAGPDGYFASEDVGALEAARDPTLGPAAAHTSSGPKFQLNKQLYKALEQARALRRANNQPAGRSARKRSSESAASLEASEPTTAFQSESVRSDDILASSSSDHQSVRFATRINHVVGTNGITYATAFRPTPASPTMASAVLSPHQSAAAQGQQQQQVQASASKPVYVSTRYEPFRVAGPTHDLRSQLPAPIWVPPTNEDSHGSLNYYENSNLPNNQQQQVAANYYPPATHHQSSSVLQSHPAWTLLNNNYNNGNYQTSLFIDHAGAPTSQQHQPAVGQTFALDAHREAQLLAALNERRPPLAAASAPVAAPAPAPAPVVPASQAAQIAQHPASQSESFAPAVFGTRTASPPQQVTVTQPSYNYGFALRHFDAPLYHPEVHETRADQVGQASQSVAGGGDIIKAPAFSYATTVMHSEVAAEQAYKPERLTGAAQSELVHADELRSSASSSAASLVASSEPAPASEVVRREASDGAAAADGAPLQSVAYATRLSALADDELSMEDSEQVGYLPNGTHTSHLSRARLPDRSKKLSSIFKARQLGQDHGEVSPGEAGSGTARIRRPVPINAKKQFAGGAASTSGRDFVQPAASLSRDQEQSRAPEPRPPVAESAATPPKSTSTGKKFGANLRQAPSAQDLSLQDDINQAPVVAAKKRPVFVEPTKSKQLEPTQLASSPSTTSSTTTTTTSTTTTTEAPSVSSESSDAESSTGATAAQVPQAVIVDATSGLASSGQLSGDGANRDLIEKIMRIQQELASKAAKLKESPPSTTTSTSTTTSKPTTPPQVIEQPTTTTERPTTTTTTTTTTTQEPSTSSSTTTTTSAPEIGEASGANSSNKLTLISDNELALARESQTISPLPVSSSTTSTTTEQPALSFTPSSKNLLTGPLVRMVASSSDQDDFMSMSMTADSLGFDSTRAVVMSNPDLIRAANQSQEVKAESNSPIGSSSTSSATAAPLPFTTARATEITGESAPEVHHAQPATTTKEPQLISSTETVNFVPQTQVTTTSTAAPSAIQEATQNPDPAAGAPQSTTTTTTTSTTTTSTTTAKPVPLRVRTTSQPARFGRLVIKRGDKVVARYNASDAIPDSMIPVSGTSGEIIMPDMPRLGMRRSMATRRRASSASSSTTSTTSTTTTERPARVTTANASEPQLVNATTASVEPVALSTTNGGGDLLAPTVRPTTTTTTTSGRNETIATSATTNSGRLKRKSLLRGARSPTGQAQSESDGDLINEESAPIPQATSVISASRGRTGRALESSTPTATRQPAASIASSRFGIRNSWSSRLRDNIGRQMAAAATATGANATQGAPKKYDPEEDLKKLVEKIERIQFESSAGLARDRDDVLRRPVNSVQIDVLSPPPPPTMTRGTSSANRTSSETTTTVIPFLPVASGQQQVAKLTTANMTTHHPTVPSFSNVSTVTPGLSNTTSSQSSSISFTLAVSPDIESQWSKMKPVNLTTNQTVPGGERPHAHLSALITRLTGNSTQQQTPTGAVSPASNQTVAPLTQLDIRVDSHGHIHVRNNQSITVHVDIEPPKRNSTQKRITSRDTSAVSALFGRDDIQRSKKQTTTTTTASRVSSQAATSTTPATTNPNQVSGEETAALLKRRPRMLCIEVESNDSDLLRQKRGEPMTRLQTPRIAPDVAP